MSPTKQAKAKATVEEPKLHQATEWRKTPRENPDSVGAGSPLANGGTVITEQIGSKH